LRIVAQHDGHAADENFSCAIAFCEAQHDAQVARGATAASAARLARHRPGGRRWIVVSYRIQT
jgi:hypothetical protein